MEEAVFSDEFFMKEALKEAHKAADLEEVPVGVVVVSSNRIIARAHNMTQQLNDITAHAEMIAITSAANFLGGKYLDECTLYVTLEPCLMCASALKWAQLQSLVYGASDPREGYTRIRERVLHPKTLVTQGILEAECSELVRKFFRKKRKD